VGSDGFEVDQADFVVDRIAEQVKLVLAAELEDEQVGEVADGGVGRDGFASRIDSGGSA